MTSSRSVIAEDEIIRPIVLIRILHPSTGRSKIIYGMLDSGADRDVISETVIEDMGIETTEMAMRVVTVDNCTTNRRSLASFTVESVDGSYRADVNGALVGRLLTGEGDVPPHRRDLSSFPYLQDVDFDSYDADVAMIICAAHADAC